MLVRKAINIDLLRNILGYNLYISVILKYTNLVNDEDIYFRFENVPDSN